MKKLYVKPVAMNVVYAVNENISLSGIFVDPGKLSFNHAVADCNKYLNHTTIETGLPDGPNPDAAAAMKYIIDHQDLYSAENWNKFQEMLAGLTSGGSQFICGSL